MSDKNSPDSIHDIQGLSMRTLNPLLYLLLKLASDRKKSVAQGMSVCGTAEDYPNSQHISKEHEHMAVFRIEKTKDYTVMSNHHLRDKELSLKAKGLLSLMLSLPESWDYTLAGLAIICQDGISSVRSGVSELEKQGYLSRRRIREANGQLGDVEYTILEVPAKTVGSQSAHGAGAPPVCGNPISEKPICENPILVNPTYDNHTQLITDKSNTKESITHESNIHQSIHVDETAAPQEQKEIDTMDAIDIYR